MKVGIIGSGISGLVCAHLLHGEHDVTVFEAADYIGGHTHTVEVLGSDGNRVAVDTGFIVYNERTYPNFIRLLRELNVSGKPTEMSFSVRCERTGLEYGGASLNALFAQRRNVLRPSFLGMVRDILRFNSEAPRFLDGGDPNTTMAEFLEQGKYGHAFREHYIVPMAAAVWSSPHDAMLSFPALFLIRFFRNHGLLSIRDRPQWYVVQGGSRSYVDALVAPFRQRVRLDQPVVSVRRTGAEVEVVTADGTSGLFDEVIIATHSDQALAMLVEPSPAEREILAQIPYQENLTALHTDTRLMPRRRKVWSSWNSHIPERATDRVSVTYNMNILQGLDVPQTYLVTLNHVSSIRPECMLQQFTYAHPQFSAAAVRAQKRWEEISGVDRIHYCGAYWRNGFHEDGVVSALRVCARFGARLGE